MRTLQACLAALLALPAAPAIAQLPRLEAGLQAGPSLSWLRGNDIIDNSDPLLGAPAGLTFQYDFSRAMGLRIGAGYQRKGSSTEVLLTDVNGQATGAFDVRNHLDYLMIPLMARASFGNGPRFFVAAGPYLGGLFQAREIYSGSVGIPDREYTDDLAQWDLGLSAGLGASFSIGGDLWLNAEARYDKGLTNISELPVINDGRIRTNAVCLLVGASYRFGSAL